MSKRIVLFKSPSYFSVPKGEYKKSKVFVESASNLNLPLKE
ncbi:MAG: hypothetical protein ABDH49_00370 [Candidatus Hydrothermales bacterium]